MIQIPFDHAFFILLICNMKLLFEFFPFQFLVESNLPCRHTATVVALEFRKLNIIKYQYDFNGFENAKIARNWNIRFELCVSVP